MKFNKHYSVEGSHAFLSASKHHWINYDLEKLLVVYERHRNSVLGSRLHAFAAEAIRLKIKQSRNSKSINRYINDGIGFRMTPEQVLYFSPNCYGTADTISFDRGKLRIHDLKTGGTRASIKQLLVYAAIFCLEYEVRPDEIEIELRLYQDDEVLVHIPEPDEVSWIMSTIIVFDRQIESIKAEQDVL